MKPILTVLILALPFLTSAQYFIINNFTSDIEVKASGTLEIHETIEVTFSEERHGIYRDIPTDFRINGKKKKLAIKDINVEGHQFKVQNNRGLINIRIGSPDKFVNGKEVYKISYSMQNGILDFPENQELYLDVTGQSWKAEIQNVHFSIRLPYDHNLAEDELKVTTGRQNENKGFASIRQADSRTIVGSSTRSLAENEGLTLALKLPKSFLEIAASQSEVEDSDGFSKQNPWLLLFPLGFFAAFFQFWKNLRSRFLNYETIEPIAYPPEGLTSAHVGAYIDQTANTRDIVSMIPYWAGEGFLEMKQMADEIYLYKLKDLDSNFPDYEQTIFNRLFSEGGVSKVSDLNQKFYTALRTAKAQLTKEVKGQGYYDDNYLEWFRSWKLILFPLASVIMGIISLAIFNSAFLGIGFILISIVGFIFPFFNLPLSEKGALLQKELEGLKLFLTDPPEAELEQLLKNDPKYFDKMLPFAVAFGLEKVFLTRSENYLPNPPYWYYTDGANSNFSSFKTGFNTETIQSAFSSTPPADTSSGGGGGFSAGGGGGGGGGGSW